MTDKPAAAIQVGKRIAAGQGLSQVLLRRASEVELDWDVRQKSRIEATDSLGRALNVFLPRGTVLRGGDVLVGEDLADFGGLVLAIAAWKMELAAHPAPQSIDGFTPDQRFFIGMAQWACSNDRPEQLRLNAATNPHSPNKYRVNGLVANFKEFETAFSCKPGQPMAPFNRCRVC